MNKNIGPFLAFDKKWFEKHQKVLIWLLNTPIIKIWFRWVMRIHGFDCSLKSVINRIEPNAFWFDGIRKNDVVEVKADFRTHWKFSKRIYFSFRPIWWALHYWDQVFADKFIPRLSFGFATLTVYPDANPETTSVDGRAIRNGVSETWATLIAGAGVSASDTVTDVNFNGTPDAVLDKWARLDRVITLFDTSALGSTATISSAVLSLWGNSKSDPTGLTPNIDIYTSTPASNTALVAGDFSQIGSVSQTGAPISYAGWNGAGAYNAFTFDATGRGNISKTSVSKFGVRNANYDVAASAPTWNALASIDIGFAMADTADTTNDPKLVITYTLPTAAKPALNLLLLGAG